MLSTVKLQVMETKLLKLLHFEIAQNVKENVKETISIRFIQMFLSSFPSDDCGIDSEINLVYNRLHDVCICALNISVPIRKAFIMKCFWLKTPLKTFFTTFLSFWLATCKLFQTKPNQAIKNCTKLSRNNYSNCYYIHSFLFGFP